MSKKSKSKVRLYDLASDSMVEVGQELANRLYANERLFFVYLRAQLALFNVLGNPPVITGYYTDPAQLLRAAAQETLTPSDEYKKLAAKLLTRGS